MGTLRQKRLARAIVDDLPNAPPATGGQLLAKVGYSHNLVKQPGRVLEAVGVTEELMALGFSVEEADRTVAHVLKTAKKDNDRLGAADRIYKRYGANAPDKTESTNVNVNVNTNPEELNRFKEIRDRYEKELLETLKQ